MIRHLVIAASVVAVAAIPAIRAGAHERYSFGHHGYGTRHAQRHYHYRHGWPIAVPTYDRYYRGGYYPGGGYYATRTYVIDRVTRAAPRPSRTETGGDVQQLSERLERLSNEVCLDMHHNYRHNPGFAETYRDAYKILDTARYIHDTGHQNNRDEIARRLIEAHDLFRQVQEEVGRWSRRPARQIGQGSALTKLGAVESALHQLITSVSMESATDGSETAPPPAELEIPPSPERPP
jgi:hypothetical protein